MERKILTQTKAAIFTHLYNAICYLYHEYYNEARALAYVKYQNALAICEHWEHCTKIKIDFCDCVRFALDEFNAVHKTEITPAQFLDDLTEIRKAF